MHSGPIVGPKLADYGVDFIEVRFHCPIESVVEHKLGVIYKQGSKYFLSLTNFLSSCDESGCSTTDYQSSPFISLGF